MASIRRTFDGARRKLDQWETRRSSIGGPGPDWSAKATSVVPALPLQGQAGVPERPLSALDVQVFSLQASPRVFSPPKAVRA